MVALDAHAVLEALPHRYPFLLVDRVETLVPGVSAVGFKNVSHNEPFSQGHFPGNPVFPGVLCLEALAQLSGILWRSCEDMQHRSSGTYFLARIEGARFKRPVLPGDQLILEVSVERAKGTVARFLGVAKVGDSLAAEATITLAYVA